MNKDDPLPASPAKRKKKKNINKKIKATKQMESEVAELLIITSTTYFIIIKSFFWLQAAT